MAMTKTAMAASIVANIKIITPMDAAQEAIMITNWEAICQGIIDEIVDNAVTSTEVTAGSSVGTYEGTVTS